MPRVWIPTQLRELTRGREVEDIGGRTLGQVVDELEIRFPGIRDRLVAGDKLVPGLSLVVDGSLANKSLWTSLDENCEIHFLPAISGG